MDAAALNSAELQRLISQEKERAMVNEMVAKLTSACWDKCITGTPGKASVFFVTASFAVLSFDLRLCAFDPACGKNGKLSRVCV